MKILAGWNNTDQARDGLKLAVELSRALDAELLIGWVRGPGTRSVGGGSQGSGSVEGFAELLESATEVLGDIAFTPYERQGDPATELRELAEQEGADLLVMGSSHRGRLERVLFGSVAEAFLQSAPCPVAVAPGGYADRSHPGFALISAGYDGTRESRRAIEVAGALASQLGADVDVVSAVPEWAGEDLPGKAFEPLQDHILARAERGAERLPAGVDREPKAEVGDATHLLEAFGVESDLLVVGSRDHSRLRRTIEGATVPRLIAEAPCPVVFVPRGAGGALTA